MQLSKRIISNLKIHISFKYADQSLVWENVNLSFLNKVQPKSIKTTQRHFILDEESSTIIIMETTKSEIMSKIYILFLSHLTWFWDEFYYFGDIGSSIALFVISVLYVLDCIFFL